MGRRRRRAGADINIDRMIESGEFSQKAADGSLHEVFRGRTEQLAPLFFHDNPRVVHDAMEATLLLLPDVSASVFLQATSCITDSNNSRRSSATMLLTHAWPYRERFEAALDCSKGIDPKIAEGIKWYLSDEASNADSILSALNSDDSVLQRFAIAASARSASRDGKPLQYAMQMKDEGVRSAARSVIPSLP